MSGETAQTIAASESLLTRLMEFSQTPAGAAAFVLVIGGLALALSVLIRLYYRERRGYTEDVQAARKLKRIDQQEHGLTEARNKLIKHYQQEVMDLKAAVTACHEDSAQQRHALQVLYVVLSGDRRYADKLGATWEDFIGGKITVQAMMSERPNGKPERRGKRKP